MTEIVQTNQARRPQPLRAILLLLALITSPLICCGAVQVLDVLPASLLPPALDFAINLFESQARVENRTAETLYLTAITTTYGEPMVIAQNISFRQRDIPLEPNSSVALQYDAADLPLAGIAVCRNDADCRLLAVNNSGAYSVDSYESLPPLEPTWLEAMRSRPRNNYGSLLFPLLSLLPILSFAAWLYLGRSSSHLSQSNEQG